MKPVEATLVILLFSSVDSFAGQAPPPSVLRVYSSLGYSQASFDEVKEYYVSIAPLWDISIAPRWFHAEFDMGRMYMIGVGVSVSRFKLLEAGFSVGYSYSRATGSMYNPAGTLYLDGSVNTFIVSVPVQINLVDLWDATVYTRVEPNLTYTSLSLPGRFRDAQTPPSWYNTELSFAGLCLGAQASLGRVPRRNVGRPEVVVEVQVEQRPVHVEEDGVDAGPVERGRDHSRAESSLGS